MPERQWTPALRELKQALQEADSACVEKLRRLLREMIFQRLATLGLARVTLDFVGSVQSTRRDAGESPAVEEYLARYPRAADVLREVLSAVQTLGEASGRDPAREGAPSHASLAMKGSFGDFELIREIGRGGRGVVYEAEQISLGRRVALKTLPLAGMLDVRQIRRFQNEARAAAHLHHSNILPIFSVGCERGVHYYAMQLVDGPTLAEVIRHLRAQERRERPIASIEQEAASADNGQRGYAGDSSCITMDVNDPQVFAGSSVLARDAAEGEENARSPGLTKPDEGEGAEES